MAKIIATDNFGRPEVSDSLVESNVDEIFAIEKVKALNEKNGEYGPYFFKVVSDDYKLYDSSEIY